MTKEVSWEKVLGPLKGFYGKKSKSGVEGFCVKKVRGCQRNFVEKSAWPPKIFL
jgi:hypothetical protein